MTAYPWELCVQEAVHQVVVHLWEKHEEVPYIAAYRKQLAGELRALHKHDQPKVTSESDRNDAYPVGTLQVWPPTADSQLHPMPAFESYGSSIFFQRHLPS